MSEDWKFELVLLDDNGKAKQRWSNFASASDGFALKELLKAHWTEALNDCRSFGALRASISWLPSILALAIVYYLTVQTYVASATSAASAIISPVLTNDLTASIVPIGLLFVTLLFIFSTQRTLEKQQERRRRVATRAQEMYIHSIDGITVYPLTYQALLEQIAGDRTSIKWDRLSKALFVFFSLTMVGQLALLLLHAQLRPYILAWLSLIS